MFEIQEIIAFLIVGAALVYVVRSFVRKNISPEESCGGCGKCAASEREANITVKFEQK